jgi:hypothetical protein
MIRTTADPGFRGEKVRIELKKNEVGDVLKWWRGSWAANLGDNNNLNEQKF